MTKGSYKGYRKASVKGCTTRATVASQGFGGLRVLTPSSLATLGRKTPDPKNLNEKAFDLVTSWKQVSEPTDHDPHALLGDT